jgi:hypothetical protein
VPRFAAGLLVGLLAGAAAGAGATYVVLTRPAPVSEVAPSPATEKKPPRKGGRRPVKEARTDDEAPIELSAADRMPATEGDALRAAPLEIDMQGAAEPRDLSQPEIDAAFGQRAEELVACITEARGAAPLTGRVTAGVVVGADGRVRRTRVEAPAYLLKQGLGKCARRELSGLTFPATGKETVVTVPFDVAE